MKLPTRKQMIAAARGQYQSEGEIEIDDNAKLSRAEGNPDDGERCQEEEPELSHGRLPFAVALYLLGNQVVYLTNSAARQIFAADHHPAIGRLFDAHQQPRHRCLATAAFSHDAEARAFRQQNADIVEADALIEDLCAGNVEDVCHRCAPMRLAAAQADVRSTTITQPSLESLFIKLTGRELRE